MMNIISPDEIRRMKESVANAKPQVGNIRRVSSFQWKSICIFFCFSFWFILNTNGMNEYL